MAPRSLQLSLGKGRFAHQAHRPRPCARWDSSPVTSSLWEEDWHPFRFSQNSQGSKEVVAVSRTVPPRSKGCAVTFPTGWPPATSPPLQWRWTLYLNLDPLEPAPLRSDTIRPRRQRACGGETGLPGRKPALVFSWQQKCSNQEELPRRRAASELTAPARAWGSSVVFEN